MTTTIATAQFQTSPFAVLYEDPYIHLQSTHLDLTDTQNAFDQGKRAYEAQDYTRAIEFYTKSLKALHRDLQSIVLLHRAVAYEKSQKYQEALDDCTQVEDNDHKQQLSSRPDTYWVKANVFLRQNKPQQVTYTYKKGADTISKQIFPEQKKLLMKQYDHWMKAMGGENQKMLLQQLPYEVLSKILSLLPLQTLGQWALTCRFWYKFILQEWEEVGSCVDVSSDHHELSKYNYRYLTQFLRHIQPTHVKTVKLDIDTLFGTETMLQHLIQNNWNKVEILEINPLDSNYEWRSVLTLNKDSIRKLKLIHRPEKYDYKQFDYNKMLTDAIQICNNIQTITFSSDGNPLDFQHDIKTSLTSSSWFPIDIYLACPVDYGTLIQILKKTPSLISLRLCNEICTNSIKVIYEYLPQLQCLELSRNYWDKDQFSITYSRSQDEYSTMTGMKSLLLNLYDCLDPTNFDRLYALILKRSYYTLEYLEIHYDNILSTQKTFAVLAELGAPNLQVLYLTPFLGTVTPSPRVLSQLLLACPALQTVHFGGSDYVWSDHLYEALGKLPMLTYLSLPLGNVDPRDDMKEDHSSSDTAELESPAPNLDKIYKSATPSGALALFEQTKSLWSLYINYSYLYPVDQLTMNVLTCIGTCISLRKLDISAVIFNNEQLMTFLDSMKYSNIHTLEIHSPTRPVHEKELKALASLPRVEVLKIFDYGKSLGKGFDKPRLFRLFQEHQMDRPFIVYIYGLLAMNGWKQPTSSSVSSIDNNKIKCLHKLYSIQEPESNYDNNIDDDDNYDRDDSNTNPENHDTNSPHGDRILYNGVFCIECGCDHGLQTGYNYVNEVYKDSPNL